MKIHTILSHIGPKHIYDICKTQIAITLDNLDLNDVDMERCQLYADKYKRSALAHNSQKIFRAYKGYTPISGTFITYDSKKVWISHES
jgi:hypothetical protein